MSDQISAFNQSEARSVITDDDDISMRTAYTYSDMDVDGISSDGAGVSDMDVSFCDKWEVWEERNLVTVYDSDSNSSSSSSDDETYHDPTHTDSDVEIVDEINSDTDTDSASSPPNTIHEVYVQALDESILLTISETVNCPICLQNVLRRYPHALLCGHVICKFCADRLTLKPLKICPICRKEFQQSDLRRIYLNNWID